MNCTPSTICRTCCLPSFAYRERAALDNASSIVFINSHLFVYFSGVDIIRLCTFHSYDCRYSFSLDPLTVHITIKLYFTPNFCYFLLYLFIVCFLHIYFISFVRVTSLTTSSHVCIESPSSFNCLVFIITLTFHNEAVNNNYACHWFLTYTRSKLHRSSVVT